MSWLLFMDESGHDHKNTPAEVRGGVAIRDAKIWPFLRAWQKMEMEVFGVHLADYKIEIKGHRLLDKDRFKWAQQLPELPDEERRSGVRRFVAQKMVKQCPGRVDTEDRRFVGRMQAYFTRTQTGRQRASHIIPAPLFVASDMSVGVQAADIVLYCINWGFRYTSWNMNGAERAEIRDLSQHQLSALQFRGHGSRDGVPFDTWGIFFVPDPYGARPAQPERQERR